jgi:hypothetical protein
VHSLTHEWGVKCYVGRCAYRAKNGLLLARDAQYENVAVNGACDKRNGDGSEDVLSCAKVIQWRWPGYGGDEVLRLAEGVEGLLFRVVNSLRRAV